MQSNKYCINGGRSMTIEKMDFNARSLLFAKLSSIAYIMSKKQKVKRKS